MKRSSSDSSSSGETPSGLLVVKVLSKSRFDDVDDSDDKREVRYAYRGWFYVVKVDDRTYKLRTYDTDPETGIVSDPIRVWRYSETRALVDWMVTELGCNKIDAYRPSLGGYDTLDTKTLRFLNTDDGADAW
ncbi:MAG: hypothetical protein AAGI54_09180 [Planctomycetota bacterium]